MFRDRSMFRDRRDNVNYYFCLTLCDQKTVTVSLFSLFWCSTKVSQFNRTTYIVNNGVLKFSYFIWCSFNYTKSNFFAACNFSSFFACFVTLSLTCSLSPHIIHNYATLCNTISQLNYCRKTVVHRDKEAKMRRYIAADYIMLHNVIYLSHNVA